VHCPGPPAPTGLRSTFVDSTRIDLAWDPPPPGRVIARYRLYRQTSGTPMTLLSDTLTGQAYRDSGLTPFTPYTYQVEALDAAGLVSPRSRPLTVRTLDGSPPSAATNLTATARSALRIDVTWTAAVDPETGIRRYRVYRDDVLVDSTSATSYADVGLAANTAYRYFVIAVNGQGLSGPPSNAGSAKTLDNTPPTAPSALSAVAVSTTQIDLAWLAASDPESGVVLYRIYRDGTVVGTTAALTYNDTGLTPRTTYTYVVTAVNGAGLEGPPSNSASATTHTPPIVTGDLVVSTQSVGSGIPPNGYQVQVTSLGVSVTQPVGPIGSTTFSQLAPQTYTVLLTSLPANCVVDDGANPRSVSVTAGGTATTTFRVRCQ
jgi:chitodextrinase